MVFVIVNSITAQFGAEGEKMRRYGLPTMVLWFAFALPAYGQFYGNEIFADWIFPGVDERHTVTASEAVELPDEVIANAFHYNIDIGENYILFDVFRSIFWADAERNGWEFTDLSGTLPAIVNYTIGEIEGQVSGLNQSDLSFTAESVFANFRGVSMSADTTVRLDVEFGCASSLRVVGESRGALEVRTKLNHRVQTTITTPLLYQLRDAAGSLVTEWWQAPITFESGDEYQDSSPLPGPSLLNPGSYELVLWVRGMGGFTAVVTELEIHADGSIASEPRSRMERWTEPDERR